LLSSGLTERRSRRHEVLDFIAWTDPATISAAAPPYFALRGGLAPAAELCAGGGERGVSVADVADYLGAVAEAWLGAGVARQVGRGAAGITVLILLLSKRQKQVVVSLNAPVVCPGGLTRRRARQVAAFRSGLAEAVRPSELLLFSAPELGELVLGPPRGAAPVILAGNDNLVIARLGCESVKNEVNGSQRHSVEWQRRPGLSSYALRRGCAPVSTIAPPFCRRSLSTILPPRR
jgi:hypothetical protein